MERARISLHNIAAGFVVADVLSVMVAGAFLAGVFGEFRSFEPVVADWQVWALALGVCAHLVMARTLDVYSTRTIFSKRRTIYRLALSLISAFIALLIIAVATKTSGNYSRRWFFSWMFLSISLVTVLRLFALERLRRVLREGAFVYKAFSIGVFCDPISPREIARRTNNEVRVAESLRLGAINELASMSERIAQDEIDRVYIAAPWVDIPAVLRNLLLLRHLATRVFIVPGDQRAHMNVVGISFLGDKPMFCAIEEPMQGWSLWLKRFEDVCISLVGLCVLSPLLLGVAIAIRLDSPGPILFRQNRVGFNGKVFELWKFRSMFMEDADHHAAVQTSRSDPRVTRVGRFIRRTSLDELPQIFNVLMGTMSIVGPRPHALLTRAEGRNLEELVDYYAVRHRVRPGMTGLAQVNGLRGELDSTEKLQKRVDFDIQYIDNWTIWLDIKIIFKTVMLVFKDSTAY